MTLKKQIEEESMKVGWSRDDVPDRLMWIVGITQIATKLM